MLNREAGRIWVAACGGAVVAARMTALRMAATARAHGSYAVEAFALHEAVRLGLVGEVADRLAEAARAYQREGRSASARAAAGRSQLLAQRCEGCRTPGLERAVLPQPLTIREREIAGLAAQGLSSQHIAERLVLSVRTIDNHLHRAYAKLGVSSRTELTTVLSLRAG